MKELYKEVANILLDRMCEVEGINATIKLLLDSGFTEEDLCALDFDKDDIETAKGEI